MTILIRSGGDPVAALRKVAHSLRAANEPVAIVAADLVIAEAALAPVTSDPFAGTALLVRPAASGGDVRVRHHMVASAGSGFHAVTAPDHRFVGAMVVSAADTLAAAPLIDSAASAVADGRLGDGPHDPVQLAALALVRSGMPVRAVEMVDVPWFRSPADPDAARLAAGAVPDDRIAQLQANRIDDGFYSTFVVRRLSKPLTRLALRLGMSPNAVTLISFGVGLAAAASFAVGTRWALVLGAVLLQLSLIIDCVDGEVARATRRFSALGAWLDASTDRVKEYLAYAGLALGSMAVLGVDIWPLAVAMVVLQTTRHMTDYDFSRVQRAREARVEPRAITDPDDGGASASGAVAGAMEMSARVNRRSAVRWAKRAIHMPIGERWLVISVMAAVFGAAWALTVLIALGLVALAYVLVGRTLRTMTWSGRTPGDASVLLARQADAGPLASLAARAVPVERRSAVWASRGAWAIPAGLRLAELGAVALLALLLHPSATVLAFWWITIIAFHHYDVLYRAIQGSTMPRWLTWAGLGFDGRTVIVVVSALAGAAVFSGVLAVGIVVWSLLLVVVASIQWLAGGSR